MILLADNQPLTADALTFHFKGQPFRRVTGKAELVLALEEFPDAAVVIDFVLFDFATPENLLIFLRRFPQSRWLMLSAEFADGLLRMYGSEPAVSFLTKDCTGQEVLSAVYRMQQGCRTVCPSVADHLRQAAPTVAIDAHLTPTEKEILSLIAQGKTAKTIAQERCSSVHTIVTHKKNIFRKLGVSTVYEATRYALRAGLADPVEYYI